MGLALGLVRGLTTGEQSTLNPTGQTITVGRDGPGSAYVPVSAGDWAQLSLPTPMVQWGCQESSGNLSSSIGASTTLTAAGANMVYQQSVTGWNRRFVGFSAETANARWSTTSALLDAAAGQSVAWLIYASSQMASSAQRLILTVSVAVQNTIRVSTTGWQHVHNSTAANANATPVALDNVRALIWYRNAATDTSGLLTPTENHLGTHDESAFTAGTIKGIGTSGSTTAICRVGLLAVWQGADAETIARASTLTSLGW